MAHPTCTRCSESWKDNTHRCQDELVALLSRRVIELQKQVVELRSRRPSISASAITVAAIGARATDAPIRIQLSRKKGWRMPPNTVKVDRTTKLGNPFIVGTDGTAPECVYWFVLLLCGYRMVSCSMECNERQEAFLAAIKREGTAGDVRYPKLRGKNLACWCAVGKPCHADVLLQVVNRTTDEKATLDIPTIMAGYGYRMESGRPVRIARSAPA